MSVQRLAPAGPFFHGGVPGLSPGDRILPVGSTRTQHAMRSYLPAWASRRECPWLYRDDVVYFSPHLKAAALYAMAYPDGGLYEVRPDGAVTEDPDPGAEGRFACSATITRVVTPRMELPRDMTMDELVCGIGADTALSNRIASALRSESPRWASCRRGHTHWGQFGAAGLLLREEGPRYLLQMRGGTWGLPGGALRWEEHPYNGVLRKAVEEMGPLPVLKPRVIGVDDHGGWKYHTVMADVAEPFTPVGGDGEGVAYRWCTEAEVPGLSLHPGLAEGWPRLADLRARY
ncbi:NUDIX domain-containing protein [Streptomyces europaeiscabiei]|uniref:NUDIX domain-containing protein n=1 Tax=Streptomyces europaeiscabiei TaxID=146819 RepID=UPI002E17CEB8